MSAMKILFTFLLLLIHSCQSQQDGPQQSSQMGKGCQNFDLITVRNSSRGIQVLITTASDLKGRNLDLQGYYLPSECGRDIARCNLATFWYQQRLYVLIPSIRGMVAITYNYVNSTDPQFTHQFVPATRSCNIVKMFYTGPSDGYRVIGACMELPVSPEDEGSMYILDYRFRVDENGTGFFVERKSSTAETIYNPDTVSEVVYARGQRQCSSEDNVYFIDDGYVIQYPVDRYTIGAQFAVSLNYLRRCSTFDEIEHFGGSNVVVYCSNNTAAVHNTCTGSTEYYDSSESGRGIPYPCSNWNTVVYLKMNNTLSFNNQEIPLPKPVVYGKCIGSDPPVFIAVTSNGTISVVLNEEGNASIDVISNGCIGPTKSDCFQPIFNLEDESIIGMFDERDEPEFVVANLSRRCGVDPISFRLHIPTQPHLAVISLHPATNTYNCTCTPKNTFVDEPITEMQDMPTTSSSSSNSNTGTTDADMKVDPPAQQALRHLVVSALVPIAVIIICTVVAMAVVVVIFRSKKRARKYTGIYPLNDLQATGKDKERVDSDPSLTTTSVIPLKAKDTTISGSGQEQDKESKDVDPIIPIPESAGQSGGVDVANGSSLPHPSSNYHNGRLAGNKL